MSLQSSITQLNPAQKKAVETIDGPVMVVAGPGTGKTQVLALRIAHILTETDTPGEAILCLTFTRSGVSAMKNRLESYIGSSTARTVKITTFHSFAIELIEKYYTLLNFDTVPELLDDTQAAVLVDELLENGAWSHLRPRTDPAKYFHELKGLISLLKRERMSPTDFLVEVEKEIQDLKDDPTSLSTRGESKGQLKKEIEKKIESLDRSREVVTFYEAYEELKLKNGFMDYDDVLEYVVQLAMLYEDVRADIRENYLYVLIDEHQDSSGVQNNFLKAVWGDVEKPNIFVVGDDRQLIYGFSGANLDYFTEFKTYFGKAEMIVLTENYRSTAPILALADELLQSTVTREVLNSSKGAGEQITLSEFVYDRDEIIGAGLYFKKLIDTGTNPSECALLLPKNRHVKSAASILKGLGLPVVSEQSVSLLDTNEAISILRIFKLIVNPHNSILLAEALLDKTSGVLPLTAHTFLKNTKKPSELTLDDIKDSNKGDGLFASDNKVATFGEKLSHFINTLTHESVSHVVSVVGNELLIDQAKDHKELLKHIEIVRSFIHIATLWEEKHPRENLASFLEYMNRISTYGSHVPVAQLGGRDGVRVMTLHKSKGLEYEHVWIGHMNEEILMSQKHSSFTLPESVKVRISLRDILTAKRELYVAITRAKKFCTISYGAKKNDGVEGTLAHIVSDLSDHHFKKVSKDENEENIVKDNPRHYAGVSVFEEESVLKDEIQAFVSDRFAETRISVSMLNNFFECPWKWYFRNFLKLPETKTVSLALGSAVHETIEYILKSPTLLDEADIKARITYQLVHEGVRDEKEIKRLLPDAYKAVKNWIDGYYKNLAQERVSERNISYRDPQFPNLTMFGKIDLTERYPDGTMVVTDFKTGKSKTTGVIEKVDDEGRLSTYMRQLAMYSYLVLGAEKNTVSESRLLFLEEDMKNKNALYKTHVGGEEVDLLVRDITDYEQFLVSGEWMNRSCNAQSYGGGDVCEYCARIERISLETKNRS